ncbi:MAG: HAD family hydrolase [Candidatus Levyibacteriota bacterium]
MGNKRLQLDALEGIIFDIDGVLVDTEYFQWQGWVEVLTPLGKTVSQMEYLKYAGKRGDIIESELIQDFNLPISKNELLSQKEKLLIEWFHSKSLKLMPFAEEAVQYFQKKRYKLACASGSPRNEALLKLKKTGLFPLFHNVVSGSDVKRGKPFPDIYLHAADSLGLSPATCLAFEDTQYGVESAKAAGLFCFAIPNEFSQKQDFSKADGIFKNLKEAIASL